jgi:hypothetical protein
MDLTSLPLPSANNTRRRKRKAADANKPPIKASQSKAIDLSPDDEEVVAGAKPKKKKAKAANPPDVEKRLKRYAIFARSESVFLTGLLGTESRRLRPFAPFMIGL